MNHYAARVVAIDGDQLSLELRTLHCDAGPPGESLSFALNLLVDQWWRLVCQYDSYGDFRDNVLDPHRRAWNREWDVQLEQLCVLSFGKEIEVSAAEFEQARRTRQLGGVTVLASYNSWHREAMRHFVRCEGDWLAFERAAAKLVSRVSVTGQVNQDADENFPASSRDPAERAQYEQKCPRVTLNVQVAAAALLGFLQLGMEWETAVYR